MDDHRFDHLVKTWSGAGSRRRFLSGVAATVGSGLLSSLGLRRPATAQEECGPGLVSCPRGGGTVCADLTSASSHCGACGRECFGGDAPGGVCVGGVCAACDPGLVACYDYPYGTCVDISSDPNNCGDCGAVCQGGTCENGRCLSPVTCPEGQVDCDGACINIMIDPNNCGGCPGSGEGLYCPSQLCREGVCVTCEELGLAGCPGQGTGNFCWNLSTNEFHCGACGNVCESGVCEAGVCVGPTEVAEPTSAPTEPAATGEPTVAVDPTSTTEPNAPATITTEPVQGGLPASATEAPPALQPPPTGTDPTCPGTSEDENAALARRWYYEVLSGGDLALLDALVTDDVVHHAATFADATGIAGVRTVLDAVRVGFPDVRYEIEQTITQDDHVVLRWSATGTQTGPFQELPATSRPATWTGINIFRIRCGRIAEVWSEVDGLGRLRQLNPSATPPPLG